jgi:hypothetical protein
MDEFTPPPLSPSSEEIIVDTEQSFARECLSKLDHLKELGRIHVEGQAVTHSKRWGLVFRADFIVENRHHEGLVDRLVCWHDEKGKIVVNISIGQEAIPVRDSS